MVEKLENWKFGHLKLRKGAVGAFCFDVRDIRMLRCSVRLLFSELTMANLKFSFSRIITIPHSHVTRLQLQFETLRDCFAFLGHSYGIFAEKICLKAP